MNELQCFKSPAFGEVRTVVLDGEPWMVGKDVADILGYTNSRKALADHVDDEDKGVTKCDTLGGVQETVIINESGLYALTFASKLPTAKAFRRWVTSEVLPSIRKTGSYTKSNRGPHPASLTATIDENGKMTVSLVSKPRFKMDSHVISIRGDTYNLIKSLASRTSAPMVEIIDIAVKLFASEFEDLISTQSLK